jgi:hypothetical protein
MGGGGGAPRTISSRDMGQPDLARSVYFSTSTSPMIWQAWCVCYALPWLLYGGCMESLLLHFRKQGNRALRQRETAVCTSPVTWREWCHL